MIIVFDLDDTLYDERTYITSGFKTVANYLENKFNLNKEILYKEMLTELNKSRSEVFDRVLSKYHLQTKNRVWDCLMVYRKHKPKIKLYTDAVRFLRKYKNVPKYIVTDGNMVVQRNKIVALGLKKYIKHSYLTWKKGKSYSKPSPYFINLIAKKERVKPSELVYIGDNPEKDFVGIKPLGYQTVRINRGAYKNIVKSVEYEAGSVVSSFSQLEQKSIFAF
jgi:putative hydrolase of the HAD superfamily